MGGKAYIDVSNGGESVHGCVQCLGKRVCTCKLGRTAYVDVSIGLTDVLMCLTGKSTCLAGKLICLTSIFTCYSRVFTCY